MEAPDLLVGDLRAFLRRLRCDRFHCPLMVLFAVVASVVPTVLVDLLRR